MYNMSTLLEKQIRVNRTMAINTEHARAIEDPIRAKIIEILYRKSLSAEQIFEELKKSGYKKALTTTRHHIDILKETGLVEISKIEESRGAVTKFYSTSIKYLGYDTPKDFDEKYSRIIDKTSARIEKILLNIDPKTNKKKSKSDDYSQYLVMEIMNRAMTNILEKIPVEK